MNGFCPVEKFPCLPSEKTARVWFYNLPTRAHITTGLWHIFTCLTHWSHRELCFPSKPSLRGIDVKFRASIEESAPPNVPKVSYLRETQINIMSRLLPCGKKKAGATGSGAPASASDGSGGRIRTDDLRVMSPTSYLTAPPRNGFITIILHSGQPSSSHWKS